MAGRTSADRPVGIWTPDFVTFVAALRNGGRPFLFDECIGVAFHGPWMKLFRRRNLLGGEVGCPGDGGPSRRGMSAANKLLVFGLVALGAIGGREMTGDHETAVLEWLLSFNGAVTIQASDPFGRMSARFELMHNGGSFAAMTFGALSDSASCSSGRLPIFDARAIAVHDKSRNN